MENRIGHDGNSDCTAPGNFVDQPSARYEVGVRRETARRHHDRNRNLVDCSSGCCGDEM